MTTNWSQFKTDIFNAVAAVSSDPSWTTEFNDIIIDRSEMRIYRDLDLLATRVTDTSASLTTNNRSFTLPTANGTFLVLEQVSVLTPSSVAATNASRNPLVRVSPVFIDLTWPNNSSNVGVPQYFAVIDSSSILVGPSPNSSYGMEIRGTQRPTALSSGNSSTILTQQVPDLFFAAGMIEAGAFMRLTDPTLFTTWLGEYNALLKSATVEEQRKRFMAEGFVDKIPSPIATPPRQ